MAETLAERKPRSCWRALAGFSLGFRIAEAFLFLPVAAIAGSWLAGGPVVETAAIVPLLLSPRGLLLVVLGGSLFFVLRWFEHAGLSAIVGAAFAGQALGAGAAFRQVLARLPALAGAALVVTLRGILALLPLLLAAGTAAALLLARHDINFYLATRPPRFMVAIGAVALAGAVSGALLVRLVARVRLAVQTVMFEDLPPRAALARSAALTAGHRGEVVGIALALVVLTIILGAAASAAGVVLARPLLAETASAGAPLAALFALLVLVRSGLAAAATWIASVIDARMFTGLYLRLGGSTALSAPPRAATATGRASAILAAGAGALAIAASGVQIALDALGKPEDVSLHAHRGLDVEAAENTRMAFLAAFDAGADTIETDVQQTRDGALVLVHDADLARLAGVPRRVSAMTQAEIAAIRLPGSDPRIATLDDALSAARVRGGRVNIELKTYRDSPPGLAAKVVAAVRAAGMEDRVLVQSFSLAQLAEVRRLAPAIPVGFLVSVPAGSLRGLGVDFLSVERNRVNPALLALARREGLEVLAWNVTTEADMRRLLELGIDGLIIDDVATAVAVRRSLAAEDPARRTARQMLRLLGG